MADSFFVMLGTEPFWLGILFFLDSLLFVMPGMEFKYSRGVVAAVTALSVLCTVFLLTWTPPTLFWLIVLPLPSLAAMIFLSKDSPASTAYLFFDRHNVAYVTGLVRSPLLTGIFGGFGFWPVFISELISLALFAIYFRYRGESRKILGFMSRVKSPFFLLPLSITVFARFVLVYGYPPQTVYLNIAAAVVVLVNGYFINDMMLKAEKAAKAELMALEMRHMGNVMEGLSLQVSEHEKNRRDIARLRHDMRHHNSVLFGMLQENKADDALSYLNGIQESLKTVAPVVYCEHIAINTVLSIYLEQATAHGVTVKYNLFVPAAINTEDMELASIYANIIENAIEACIKMDNSAKKEINIYADYKNGQHIIEVKNTFACEAAPPKKGHGIGMKSVAYITEKYNGIFDVSAKNGIFCVRVILNGV